MNRTYLRSFCLFLATIATNLVSVAAFSQEIDYNIWAGFNPGGYPTYTLSVGDFSRLYYGLPTYGYNFAVTNHMVPGVTYAGSIACTPPTPFYGLSGSGSTGCGSINAINLTPQSQVSAVNFLVEFDPVKILFAWDFPKAGLQALQADGSSTVHGSVVGSPGAITWSFDGDNLGCSLSSDSTGVTVTAGTNAGTVVVKASISGSTCHELPLDLVKCSTCSSGTCPANGFFAGLGSVDIRIGLGWTLQGGSAGFLSVYSAGPTNITTTPAGLRYTFRRPEVQTYSNAFGLSQVKAPQVFVNVITNSSVSYSVQLFSLTNVLGYTNGGYQLQNSPYRQFTVENPGGDTNSVRVTDSNDGSTYNYTWQGSGWSLATGNGLRTELKTVSTSSDGLTNTITTTISGATGEVFTKVETFRTVSGTERLLSEVLGTGNAARTNTYTYTTAGFLQQALRWDGTWEYYLYDGYNRPTNLFSGFGRQGVTTNPGLCRLVVYDYSTNLLAGSGDTGTLNFRTPRATIEYLQGTEISRKYVVCLNGQRKEIQCTTPGASWNNSANLVTTYQFFTNGFRLNEPQVIARPDGTGDVYQYGLINPTGTPFTNIVLSGHLDSTGTNIDAGTSTTLVTSSSGLLLSKTVVDKQSGITLIQESYSYDTLNRQTNTAYLDGTSEGWTYNCCTISTHTERDGTLTSYSYDALKRLITTTVNSITVSNVLDAAGDLLAVVRFGTDSTPMTLSQTVYDDSGLVVRTLDALSYPTVYTNYLDPSGAFVKQTTYPDTGTRVETYGTDGLLLGLSGSAVQPRSYIYGAGSGGAFTTEIKLDATGGTNEWATTYVDAARRTYQMQYPSSSGPVNALSFYNILGQLTNQVDADGVSTILAYSPNGDLAYSVLDSNRNSVIDFTGTDRITFTTNDVTSDHGFNVKRTRSYVWSTSASTSNLVSTVEQSTDGLRSWNTLWDNGSPLTSEVVTVFAGGGWRYLTNIAPDSSYTVKAFQNGKLISTTRHDLSGNQLGQVTYGYDAHGRQIILTDARNGTTTNYFDNADRIVGTATPVPGLGQANEVTDYYLDSMGRNWRTSLPDGTFVTNYYSVAGLLTNASGSRTYPVSYTYDAQGRMKSMTTYFGGINTPATTVWNYDVYRGWLTNKLYADTNGPAYTYTPAGRLASRTWARGVVTTYSYNNAGDLSTVTYSDATPGLSYVCDRRGRQASATQDSLTTTYTFDDLGSLLSESYAGGVLDGLSVTNGFDLLVRRTNVVLASASLGTLNSATYSYDSASRLYSVSDANTNSATYQYIANSPLIGQVTFNQAATTRMTTVRQFDSLNRLTRISSSGPAMPVLSFDYMYNPANQRTRTLMADGSHWNYFYDSLGQVISGRKYFGDFSPTPGEQFDYNFDNIGNRLQTKAGGDQNGANQLAASYFPNSLNQYVQRTIPCAMDIIGVGFATNAVFVNGQAAWRKGEFFWSQLSVNNSTAPVWTNITVTATNQASVSGNEFLPQTPEQFTYDLDGNLTSDGRWNYVWDAENRLIALTNNTVVGPQQTLLFTYDVRGRRIRKQVIGDSASDVRFVYDGWNPLGELTSSNTVFQAYLWGADLSGSLQGAGGVGGLVAINDSAQAGHFAAFDGNGNVIALAKAADGTSSANYEYGPFGELLRATGPMAKANAFRFSTKSQDDESDLLYYGYRFYSAGSGRWISRDPAEEKGGLNIYGFVINHPMDGIDTLGKDWRTTVGDISFGEGFFGGAFNWFLQGNNVHVPFSVYDPHWGPGDFPGFSDYVTRVCSSCPTRKQVPLERIRDLYAEGPMTIFLKGGPGRIKVTLTGYIASFDDTCPCHWRFRGTVEIPPDRFDFDNPLDPGRTAPGQIITTGVWLFQNGTGMGHDFTTFFDGSRFVDVSGTCKGYRTQDYLWQPAG